MSYARDVSLGGAIIVVSPGEVEHWRAAARAGLPLVVRFADESSVEDWRDRLFDKRRR